MVINVQHTVNLFNRAQLLYNTEALTLASWQVWKQKEFALLASNMIDPTALSVSAGVTSDFLFSQACRSQIHNNWFPDIKHV